MRLIDADALLEQLKGTHAFLSHDDYVQEITNAPTVKREGWISVEDRLPDAHGNYLVVGSYDGVRAASYMGLGNQSYFQDHLTSNDEGMCDEDGLEFAVTYWQPLPAAPTLNEKG